MVLAYFICGSSCHCGRSERGYGVQLLLGWNQLEEL